MGRDIHLPRASSCRRLIGGFRDSKAPMQASDGFGPCPVPTSPERPCSPHLAASRTEMRSFPILSCGNNAGLPHKGPSLLQENEKATPSWRQDVTASRASDCPMVGLFAAGGLSGAVISARPSPLLKRRKTTCVGRPTKKRLVPDSRAWA